MADIQVLNTSAGISGKTVMLAESDQTITGGWTFSRGSAAPFTVSVGAAKVDNLDADKLEGQEGSYYLTPSNLNAAVPVSKGGTGLTSTPANGQIPVGNGSGFTLATLTEGTGISIVEGAGTITISATQTDPIVARDFTETHATGAGDVSAAKSLFSTTITGGSLSTNRRLRLLLTGDLLTTSSHTFTFRVKWGGSVQLTYAVTINTNNNRSSVRWEVLLDSYNSASAQRIFMAMKTGGAGGDRAGTVVTGNTDAQGSNDCTVDSSTDQTLELTVQLQDSSQSFKAFGVTVELL